MTVDAGNTILIESFRLSYSNQNVDLDNIFAELWFFLSFALSLSLRSAGMKGVREGSLHSFASYIVSISCSTILFIITLHFQDILFGITQVFEVGNIHDNPLT